MFPGGDLDSALDDLEHGALAGDVGSPFERGPFDVFETGQRVEVVLLVVVEGCLVAHALEGRVGSESISKS